MKKQMKRAAWLILLIICGVSTALFCKRTIKNRQKLALVEQIGPGINLGNSLDVTGLRGRRPDAGVEEYEQYWGNPPITRELFGAIAGQGFHSVRIPVSWSEHMDENGQIDPAWLLRVTQVVDWALEENLYVVLDLHHEEWLIPTPDQEGLVTEKLCTVWRQLAEQFKDYDDRLLFEGMNEPRLEGSRDEWTAGTVDMQQTVNRLNAAFVKTVRESGGENVRRLLLIPAYGSRYETGALEALEIPKDERVIVAVHAYIPYSFTLKENGEEKWDASEKTDTEDIDRLAEDLERLFLKKGIPVMITEFGCHEKEDEQQRLAWAGYYVNKMKEAGVPLFWWDSGKGSKILDRSTGEWTEKELVEILTGNTLP